MLNSKKLVALLAVFLVILVAQVNCRHKHKRRGGGGDEGGAGAGEEGGEDGGDGNE